MADTQDATLVTWDLEPGVLDRGAAVVKSGRRQDTNTGTWVEANSRSREGPCYSCFTVDAEFPV